MDNDSLALLGSKDLVSSGDIHGFVSHTHIEEKYHSPDNLINNTDGYNEVDFFRMQNGVRKQPDYIIVFRENGEIKYLEEAKKAQKQWGGLPIVVIDKDKCLEAEKQKVNNMLIEYHNGNKQLAKQIYQKIRNNRQTNKNFCEDIDIEILKQEIELQEQKEENNNYNSSSTTQNIANPEKQVTLEDLKENYNKVTPQERKAEISTIKRINETITKIISQKEGEEIE